MATKKTAATKARKADSASDAIDAKIRAFGDWRGATLARIRALILQADPEVVEELKWRGVPVWSHDGILCTGETYKQAVKMTFAKGAALPDPARLFNSSLEGNTRRDRSARGRRDRCEGVEGADSRGGRAEQDRGREAGEKESGLKADNGFHTDRRGSAPMQSTPLVLAALLVASAGHAHDAPPATFAAKLASLAGSDARNCGAVALHESADAAIACARQASAAAIPYRLAVEFQGADALAWQGAARDAQGKLWALYYDAGPAGGADAGATLSVVLCLEIAFAAQGDDLIQCKPTLGHP